MKLRDAFIKDDDIYYNNAFAFIAWAKASRNMFGNEILPVYIKIYDMHFSRCARLFFADRMIN